MFPKCIFVGNRAVLGLHAVFFGQFCWNALIMIVLRTSLQCARPYVQCGFFAGHVSRDLVLLSSINELPPLLFILSGLTCPRLPG